MEKIRIEASPASVNLRCLVLSCLGYKTTIGVACIAFYIYRVCYNIELFSVVVSKFGMVEILGVLKLRVIRDPIFEFFRTIW